MPVPSSPVQSPLRSVSYVVTKGPSRPAWDTEVKDARPGPQEAHISWRTESHRRNIARQGAWERRGEDPGQGCRGARGRGQCPAGNTGAGAQGPEGCKKQRGRGRASPVPTPRLRTRILFSGRVALLDPTVTLTTQSTANQETAGKSQMAVSACLPNDLAPTAGRALKTHTEVTQGEWVTKTQEPGLWAVPPPTPKRAAHGHQAGSAPGGGEGSQREVGLGFAGGLACRGRKLQRYRGTLAQSKHLLGNHSPRPVAGLGRQVAKRAGRAAHRKPNWDGAGESRRERGPSSSPPAALPHRRH